MQSSPTSIPPDRLVPVQSRFGTWNLAVWDKRIPMNTYHAPTLAKGLRDQPLHLAGVLADPQRGRAAAQDRHDGLDLFLVMHTAGVFDAIHGSSISVRRSGRRTLE